MNYEVQYCPSMEKLWVHAQQAAETVGRFHVRTGMDIHTTLEEQMAGKPQCLNCTHEKPTKETFDLFCDEAARLWGVEIDKTKIKIL